MVRVMAEALMIAGMAAFTERFTARAVRSCCLLATGIGVGIGAYGWVGLT